MQDQTERIQRYLDKHESVIMMRKTGVDLQHYLEIQTPFERQQSYQVGYVQTLDGQDAPKRIYFVASYNPLLESMMDGVYGQYGTVYFDEEKIWQGEDNAKYINEAIEAINE